MINVVCALLITACTIVFGQESETSHADSISDVYEYPIKPGTLEWKQCSHAEHLEMLQIPDAVLNTISTAGLLKTCLDYPFISDIHAYDNYQLGLRNVINGFNGLQELLTRAEAGRLLVKEYFKHNPNDLNPDWSITERGGFKIQYKNLEMHISQHEILTMFTQKERLELLEDCLSKYSDKVWDEAYRSTYHWRTTAFLIGRIMLKEGDSSFEKKYDTDDKLKIFLDDPGIYTIEQLNDIVLAADLYMQSMHDPEDQYE